MKKIITILIIAILPLALVAQEAGKIMPPWQAGEMEIHHIYTGRGEGAFCIFPDGTTMLIDPGDLGQTTDRRITLPSPDDSRKAGEWIARYITKRMGYGEKKYIDYVFLTHFHSDHMGIIDANSPVTAKGGDYRLSGLTEVAEYIRFGKLVDRDWPSYNYPQPMSGAGIKNHINFINWSTRNTGMQVERFKPGSKRQFTLVKEPEKYRDLFEIRNIVSNGEVWTGVGEETRRHFPDGESLDENMCSAGIKISYGAFDYFNGGDIYGRSSMYTPPWRSSEPPVGRAVGPVEVCEVNHHAFVDAMCEEFISLVRPQVYVVQVWNVSHLDFSVMRSMLSQGLYPGKRDIFMTYISDVKKAYLGESSMKGITGDGGHVVIKVAPGGKEFKVVLLTTEDESFMVKSVHGPYLCR